MTEPNTPPAAPPAPPAAPKLPPYFRTVNPDESAPIVDRSELSQGVIVKFIGTRKVDSHTPGRRYSTIHTFYARGGEGLAFAVWGSTELDSQLRKLRGNILYLRYGGKQPHATLPDRTVHKWAIQEALGARPEHIRKVRETFADQEAALDVAIGAALERDKARMALGQPEAPPPEDDDLPF